MMIEPKGNLMGLLLAMVIVLIALFVLLRSCSYGGGV